MMPLRKVVVHPGIIDSERVCALPLACQLFFRNLLHCCDSNARFAADPAELRAALYWRTPAVSSPHVEAWLLKCAQARLVKLYTRDGKRYGEVENYRQEDRYPKTIYPPAVDQVELELKADPPPKKPKKKLSGNEGEWEKAPEGATPPAPAKIFAPISQDTPQDQWLATLQAQWPAIDVPAQLREAGQVQQRQGRKLERGWFEKHWLPNVTPTVNFASGLGATSASATISPEPEAWRAWLKDHHYDESWAETAAAYEWTTMPANFRSKIERGMGDGRKSA